MKPILLAALVLTTFLFALAGCSAEEPSRTSYPLRMAQRIALCNAKLLKRPRSRRPLLQ